MDFHDCEREPSFDPDEVIGWRVKAARQRFTDNGFGVKVEGADEPSTLEYGINRYRLHVSGGRVVRVSRR